MTCPKGPVRVVIIVTLVLVSLYSSVQQISSTSAPLPLNWSTTDLESISISVFPHHELVRRSRASLSLDLYGAFDGDSAPGEGDIEELRVKDLVDCADACERLNEKSIFSPSAANSSERFVTCKGFVVSRIGEGPVFHHCFLKSVEHKYVKNDKLMSYYRLSAPNVTRSPPPPVRLSDAVRMNKMKSPLSMFESFPCDSSPGDADLEDFRVADLSVCAEACEAHNAGVRGNVVPSPNLTCHGFVAVPRKGPLNLTHCFLKGAPRSKGYWNCNVTSYYRKLPVGFNSGSKLSIVFGVLSAGHFLQTRFKAQLRTFLKNEKSVVFLEESAWDSWTSFRDNNTELIQSSGAKVELLAEPPDLELRSSNGAWKNLPILKRMHKLYPDADWLAIVDDDTYVSVESMRTSLATYHADLDRAVGVGTLMRFNEVFLQGGAGILLNKKARIALLGEYGSCMRKCRQWAGDIRMGCCAAIARVPQRRDEGFWWQPVAPSIGRDRRHEVALFPISFHEMREPQLVYDIHSALETLRIQGSTLCKKSVYSASEMCRRRAAGQANVPVTWDAVKQYYKTVYASNYTKEDYQGKPIPRHDQDY